MRGTKVLLLMAVLSLTTAAQAQIDWDEAQKKMFPVDYAACTADGHVAQVHLALTGYAPLDVPPPGYTQASKEELAAVAMVVFPANFTPYIARASDAMASADTFIGDVAMEPVEMKDENGRPVRASVIMKAMNETKAELMKTLKYSGMGISYEASTVTVNTQEKCGSN